MGITVTIILTLTFRIDRKPLGARCQVVSFTFHSLLFTFRTLVFTL
jgi:hypothetical protein